MADALPVGERQQSVQPAPAVDALELLAILRRRFPWIVLTTLLLSGLALAFGLSRVPEYLATTRILIDPRGLQVIDREFTPRPQTSEAAVAVVESQKRILTSDNVLRPVVEQHDLVNDPDFGERESTLLARLRAGLRSLVRPGAVSALDPVGQALDRLQDKVRAERLPMSYVIDLSVASRDPQKSARLADAIAGAYLASEFTERGQLASRTAGSLEQRLDQQRAKVREAEEEVERFKARHNIVLGSGGLVHEQQIAQLSQQLIASRGVSAQAQSRVEQIERLQRSGASPETIVEAVQSQTIGQLRVRLAAARQHEAGLLTNLLPAHPDVATARARIGDLSSQIRLELNRIALAARHDLERARAGEGELARNLEALKRSHAETSRRQVELRELERESASRRSVYETHLVRSREIGEQSQLDPTIARILSPASAPRFPRGASLATLCALGLTAGLALGGVLALLRERLDPRLSSARQLAHSTGRPVLAVLPNLQRRRGGVPAVVAEEPASGLAGDLRRLRSSFLDGDALHSPRLALVTAVGASEGKSMVALNLALAAAEAGDRVLLVDGDLRERRVTQARVGSVGQGLTEVLERQVPLQEAVVDDPSGRLKILPAVVGSDMTTPRITAMQLREVLLPQAKPAYDLIVVDGGLIDAERSARVFFDAADDVLVTARQGSTIRGALADLMARLGPASDKLRGSVLQSR